MVFEDKSYLFEIVFSLSLRYKGKLDVVGALYTFKCQLSDNKQVEFYRFRPAYSEFQVSQDYTVIPYPHKHTQWGGEVNCNTLWNSVHSFHSLRGQLLPLESSV